MPTLVANQEDANYLLNYHAASDTLDKVDIRELKLNTVLAALTAWGIADRVEPLGKRLSRAEMESLDEGNRPRPAHENPRLLGRLAIRRPRPQTLSARVNSKPRISLSCKMWHPTGACKSQNAVPAILIKWRKTPRNQSATLTDRERQQNPSAGLWPHEDRARDGRRRDAHRAPLRYPGAHQS